LREKKSRPPAQRVKLRSDLLGGHLCLFQGMPEGIEETSRGAA
jgi:hypothetical protein